MNQAFIKKMVEAKKMEAEAYAELLPGSQNPHLKVIKNELNEMKNEMVRKSVTRVVSMVKECYIAADVTPCEGSNSEKAKKTAKVKKVTIE